MSVVSLYINCLTTVEKVTEQFNTSRMQYDCNSNQVRKTFTA